MTATAAGQTTSLTKSTEGTNSSRGQAMFHKSLYIERFFSLAQFCVGQMPPLGIVSIWNFHSPSQTNRYNNMGVQALKSLKLAPP